MATWASSIETITLFVTDLHVAKEFYRRVFDVDVVLEDDDSVVFRLGAVLVNLLRATAAGELVEPLQPAQDRAPRAVLTVKVDDIDGVCSTVDVPLLNGPIDRPWGRRTAAFEDPDGHVWELAQDLPERGQSSAG